MTPERAKELIRLWHFNEAGCLILGAKKPNSQPLTPDESREVDDVWDWLTEANTSWFDALVKIADGEA